MPKTRRFGLLALLCLPACGDRGPSAPRSAKHPGPRGDRGPEGIGLGRAPHRARRRRQVLQGPELAARVGSSRGSEDREGDPRDRGGQLEPGGLSPRHDREDRGAAGSRHDRRAGGGPRSPAHGRHRGGPRPRPIRQDPAAAAGPRWNVDPRDDMPPLEQTLARVAEAGDLAEAIQAEAGSLHLQGARMGAREDARGRGERWMGHGAARARDQARRERPPRAGAPHAAPEGGELEQAAVSDSSQRYAGPLAGEAVPVQAPAARDGARRPGRRSRRSTSRPPRAPRRSASTSSAPAGCWAGSRATSSS